MGCSGFRRQWKKNERLGILLEERREITTEGYGVESFLKDGINYRIPLGMCTNTEIAVLIYNISLCILSEC